MIISQAKGAVPRNMWHSTGFYTKSACKELHLLQNGCVLPVCVLSKLRGGVRSMNVLGHSAQDRQLTRIWVCLQPRASSEGQERGAGVRGRSEGQVSHQNGLSRSVQVLTCTSPHLTSPRLASPPLTSPHLTLQCRAWRLKGMCPQASAAASSTRRTSAACKTAECVSVSSWVQTAVIRAGVQPESSFPAAASVAAAEPSSPTNAAPSPAWKGTNSLMEWRTSADIAQDERVCPELSQPGCGAPNG